MNTQTVCSWCEKEQGTRSRPGTSHGVCERHKAQVLAECDELAQEIAHTFTDLERSRPYKPWPLPVRNDELEERARMDSIQAARSLLIGILMGGFIFLTAVLAMFAL